MQSCYANLFVFYNLRVEHVLVEQLQHFVGVRGRPCQPSPFLPLKICLGLVLGSIIITEPRTGGLRCVSNVSTTMTYNSTMSAAVYTQSSSARRNIDLQYNSSSNSSVQSLSTCDDDRLDARDTQQHSAVTRSSTIIHRVSEKKTSTHIIGYKLRCSCLIFTALHGMQSRYSDGNSVCPSVRLSNECIVTKRKKTQSIFLYHAIDNLV